MKKKKNREEQQLNSSGTEGKQMWVRITAQPLISYVTYRNPLTLLTTSHRMNMKIKWDKGSEHL